VHYVSTQRLQRQVGLLRQQEALEKERARIARDLHDQLGANLTQVALLGEMAETDKDLPEEVESHARQIAATARDTTRALDEIVWTVNPSNDTLDGLINYVCKYARNIWPWLVCAIVWKSLATSFHSYLARASAQCVPGSQGSRQ